MKLEKYIKEEIELHKKTVYLIETDPLMSLAFKTAIRYDSRFKEFWEQRCLLMKQYEA